MVFKFSTTLNPFKFSTTLNPNPNPHGPLGMAMAGCIWATRGAAFLDEPRHGVDPGRVAAALAVPAPLAMPLRGCDGHKRCDELLFDNVLFK